MAGEKAEKAGEVVAVGFERIHRQPPLAADVLEPGLRGGGNQVGDDEVRQMTTEAGAAGFARIAADLLAATFGTNNGATPRP